MEVMKKLITIVAMVLMAIGTSAQDDRQVGYWNNKGLVELIPVGSIVYKFVWPMDDDSRETMRDLYANMKKIGNKTYTTKITKK